MLKFKYMNKYGKMFCELSREITKDLKTKTDKELEIIKNESLSCNTSNCTWTEYRIATTVYDCVDWEMMIRKIKK